MAGLSGNINLVSSGVQYALFIVFSSIMFFFVDKIGRRTLLVWGAIAMGICHFVVGGTLGAHSTYVPGGVNGDANVVMLVHGSPAYTVIAFCYLLIIFYALTLAPICWVYAAEVWSLETRASGMGISAIGNWLFNFAIGFFIPPAFVNIRWGIFIIFGVLCMLAAVQFFFTYPEVSQSYNYNMTFTNLDHRLVVRLWKRLKFCSVKMVHMHGKPRRAVNTLPGTLNMLQLRKPRAMRELALSG